MSSGMSLGQVGQEFGNFLSYLTRRQEVIASNIANADTPGYKTRDIAAPASFSSFLEQSAAEPQEVSRLSVRNDGNNVSMDRESRLLAENTLRFNIASQMLRGEIRGVKSAIEEGRSS
jgi:flagellar basal-body rod protein FlgB